jgi:antitoxin Phd
MTTFTDEQVREQLETVLQAAQSQGEARIRTHDGQEYAVRPVMPPTRSPLDIPGVDLKLSADEIVGFVREGRQR